MDALLIVGMIGSIYVAGWLAEHRGRSFKIWAWIAAFIGPLAFVVLAVPQPAPQEQFVR